MEETIFRPKKRIFMALTFISALLGSFMIYVVWKVTVPGLQQIHHLLPKLVAVVGGFIAFGMMTGVIGILLALLGVSIFKLLYFWAWKAINILFPFAVVLGRVFNVPRVKIEQSFIEVNNKLVMQHKKKLPGDRILILTPHCIQKDTCVHKITRNVENCKQCGGCSVGDMIALSHKYGCKLVVATGGTLERQMVMQARPKAIVAVACERDLTSGIQDVFPLPVLGVLNERPYGPCFNTRVDKKKLEDAILAFLDDEEANGKN